MLPTILNGRTIARDFADDRGKWQAVFAEKFLAAISVEGVASRASS
jgi:hypothetical protein